MNRKERRAKGNRKRNDIIKNYRKFLDTIDSIDTYQCEDCGSTFSIIKFKDGRQRGTCSPCAIPCEKCKEMMANADYGQGIRKDSEAAGD